MALSQAISGVTGKVTIDKTVAAMGAAGGDVVGHISRWNADARRDVFNIDEFDAGETAKTKMGGMHDIAGTCEGWLDRDAAFDLAPMVAADLLPEIDDPVFNTILLEVANRGGATSDHSYYFAAIISNLNMQVDKAGGPSRFTLSFESVGDITEKDYDNTAP